MEIVVENLRGVIVLVASLLGFAAQAAPYVQASQSASQNELAADVYVDGELRDDVYRAGAVRIEPVQNDLVRERGLGASASNARVAPKPDEKLERGEAPAAHAGLVRVVASARALTPSSP